MGRLMCLVQNDHHELLDWHLQDTLPDVPKAAADHFHVAQADVLLDRDTMAHLPAVTPTMLTGVTGAYG